MDPFFALPVELRQLILERLLSMQDLQAVILTSRPLLAAYEESKGRILQAVFRREYDSMIAFADIAAEDSPLAQITRRVNRIALKSPSDGLILREALWPSLVAHQQIHDNDSEVALFSEWSLALAEAYRNFNNEPKAREIEKQTITVLFNDHREKQKPHNWLPLTAAACAQNGSHEHGARLIEQVWDMLGETECNNDVAAELMESITQLIHGDIPPSAMQALKAVVAKAWVYLTARSRRHPVAICVYCLTNAKRLAAVARQNVGLDDFEEAWQALPPRSTVFGLWSRLFVDSHASRLEGALKVWNRLRATPDPASLEIYDLDWAGEVMWELRKHRDTRDLGLEFQASVFALLRPGSPRYYAFGRNLSDAYKEAGNMTEAIRVTEHMMRSLGPSS